MRATRSFKVEVLRTAPHRGASDGGYSVTAWRTACLYGVAYS